MNIFFRLLFIFITTGFFVGANTLTAYWAKTNQNFLWIPIFLFAIIGYILFGLLVRQTNLSISAGLVDALIVVFSILIGFFIFRDIINIQQVVGLAFACLAVILLI